MCFPRYHFSEKHERRPDDVTVENRPSSSNCWPASCETARRVSGSMSPTSPLGLSNRGSHNTKIVVCFLLKWESVARNFDFTNRQYHSLLWSGKIRNNFQRPRSLEDVIALPDKALLWRLVRRGRLRLRNLRLGGKLLRTPSRLPFFILWDTSHTPGICDLPIFKLGKYVYMAPKTFSLFWMFIKCMLWFLVHSLFESKKTIS